VRNRVLHRLRARLTPAEFVVAVLVGVVVVVWMLAGFIALGFAAPLLAGVLAVPSAGVLVAALVVVGSRVRRRAQDRVDPQHGGAFGAVVGHHVDTLGLEIDSGLPARRRAAELLARRGTDTALLRSGQATRAALHRDALALRATAGRLDFSALLAVLGRSPDLPVLKGGVDVGALIALVRLVASAPDEPEGFAGLLRFTARRSSSSPEGERVALAGILLERGETALAQEIVATTSADSWGRHAAVTDLLAASPETADRGTATWLAALNSPFAVAGLEPLVLDASIDGSPFERVRAPGAAPGSVGGPLVSVVMTVYRPAGEAVRAVESIVAQTWSDWELIVVDDASGPAYDGVLDRIRSLDPRIRIERASENSGTYARRNDGLDLARGEFVAFHDSDDWSHPRRLELQVRALERRPRVPGVVVSATRVTAQLRLWQRRGVDLRLCEPSLMVRRTLALERAGYFDPVRAGADVEYRERLGVAAGSAVVHLRTAAPLVLMRADPATLSGSDFSEGWTHPARIAYRSLHRWWRQDAGRRGVPIRREKAALPRPFPVPDHLTGSNGRHTHDVLLLADLGTGRLARGDRQRLLAFVRRTRQAGVDLALRSSPAPGTADQATDIDPRVLAVIARTGAHLRVLGERIDATDLVVLDPSILLALPDDPGDTDNADDTGDGAQVARVTFVAALRPSTPMLGAAADDVARRRWGRDVLVVSDLEAAVPRPGPSSRD
jgi:O-antigen biosynthesis protein